MGAFSLQEFKVRPLRHSLSIHASTFTCKAQANPFLDEICCTLSEEVVFLFSPATRHSCSLPHYKPMTSSASLPMSISCWRAAGSGFEAAGPFITDRVFKARMWGELKNECVVTCLAGWQLLLQLVLRTHKEPDFSSALTGPSESDWGSSVCALNAEITSDSWLWLCCRVSAFTCPVDLPKDFLWTRSLLDIATTQLCEYVCAELDKNNQIN